MKCKKCGIYLHDKYPWKMCADCVSGKGWHTETPPELGGYLATHYRNGISVVSVLWFDIRAYHKWTTMAGDPINTVIAWKLKPEPYKMKP